MRKVIVNEFMSLDGVVQAPGAADEDPSGGCEIFAATLSDPLQWQNSTRLGDVAKAVAALKEDGAELHVIGSAQLVQTLLGHGLVDELRLMIDPLVLGGGKRLFPEDAALRPLRLVNSQVTTTGAILATYAPAGS